jgi:plasmid stability protein
VKNITVSVPDEVYHAARVKAAEMGTSVSALVRERLAGLASHDQPSERGRRLLERMARIRSERADEPPFRVTENLTREELYEEAFRRHQHPNL